MNEGKLGTRFIFFTILLDALGMGVIIPILPDVIRRFGSEPEFVDHSYGYFISVYALMQFVASPVLGALSDRFGRRSILLISLVGAGLDYILMALAPTLWILFIGRIISGLTGASHTVAGSYMADISDDTNRSANFGMIGAAWGIGFILGPLIGGLMGTYGATVPFFAAAVLNLLNFAFGVFVLPESLPRSQRRIVEFRRLNPLRSVIRVFTNPKLILLMYVFTLYFFSGQVHPSNWTLYTQAKFGWTTFEVGLSLTFVGVTIGLVQGWLTRVATVRFGDWRTLMFALWCAVAGFFAYAFATQGWMMYAVTAVWVLSALAGPAIQSIISRDTPPQEQGELQGSLMSIGSLTSVFAPLVYTRAFAYFTDKAAPVHFPGIAYFLASLFCFAAICILYFATPKSASFTS